MDCTSLIFDIFLAIEWVSDHVTDYLYGFGQILFEKCHHVAGILSGRVGIQISSYVLDLKFKLISGSICCAFEV